MRVHARLRTAVLAACLLVLPACPKKVDLDHLPPAPIDPSAPMPEPSLPDASGARDLSSPSPAIGPRGVVLKPAAPRP